MANFSQEAKVVVVGGDDSETSFAFDALVENEDGACMVWGCYR